MKPERPTHVTGQQHAHPLHLYWRYLGLVALGGSVGTAARFLLTQWIGSWQQIPVATLGINLVGAFGLGVLLEELIRQGSDEGTRRSLRLLLGIGFFGGFTTYSALAVDTVSLMRDGAAWQAVGYALATVVVGACATVVGIALASFHRRRRRSNAGRGSSSASTT